MDRKMLAMKADRYWKMWLPEKTRKLKAMGHFDAAVQAAASRAAAEIASLSAQGYRGGEANDIVLPKFIYPKPESREYD